MPLRELLALNLGIGADVGTKTNLKGVLIQDCQVVLDEGLAQDGSLLPIWDEATNCQVAEFLLKTDAIPTNYVVLEGNLEEHGFTLVSFILFPTFEDNVVCLIIIARLALRFRVVE